ncbi:hypothetical protein [Saccharospirillum salsuginis]|uniref:Uncharacterized protein n=1 Tax=Saccharospirillum salsuginis TaxID=418750 RepID=A0A918K806_9GAMM|nr:hypothetical protein [Saccharospirillum salsuginis]GGX52910.1 hypothetical protein GCM10007392_20460 [Saccharospirillum salsuginis]
MLRRTSTFLLCLTTTVGSSLAATITIEGYRFPVWPEMEGYSAWSLNYPGENAAWTIPLNEELGERGRLAYFAKNEETRISDYYAYLAGALVGDGHEVYGLETAYDMMISPQPDGIQRDQEVAGRTWHLEAIPRIQPDVFFRPGFNQSIYTYDPIVYIGERERAKYDYLVDHHTVLVNSLQVGPNNTTETLTESLFTRKNWVAYSRHQVTADDLKRTVDDPEIAPHIVLVRGHDSGGYLSPGADPAIQSRTLTLVRDMDIPDLETQVPQYEPLLLVSILGLKVDQCDYSAPEAVQRLLKQVGQPSAKPEVSGKHIVTLSDLVSWWRNEPC